MTTVPFALEGGHIVVEARLAGRAGRFVLDTGSGAAAITPRFAEGLALVFDRSSGKALGAGGPMAEVRAGAAGLELGGQPLADMRTVVLPHDPFQPAGGDIAGTLGRGVFTRWTVRIDFAAAALALIEPDRFSPPAGALVRPIDVSSGVPILEAQVTPRCGQAPRPLRLILDTGTGHYPMLLGAAAAERVGLRTADPAIDVVLGVGAAGQLHGKVRRAAALGFEGLDLPDAFLGVVEGDAGFFDSGFADGTLGLGYLGRGVLTMDYAGGRVAFEPGENFAGPSPYFDACGWRIEMSPEGGWRVTWVGQDSPAEAAGARVGDRVAAVDGVAAGSIGPAGWEAALGSEGPLRVTLRRQRRTVETELQRRRLI